MLWVNARRSFYLDGNFTPAKDKVHLETGFGPPETDLIVESGKGAMSGQLHEYKMFQRLAK